MSRPLLSVIIPSRGRATLPGTLESIRQQVGRQDAEVVVVGDTHAGTYLAALLPVPALCAEYHARYVPHDGGLHAWGQPQRNHGMAVARGDWLAFSQDDGAWLPGAWAAIGASVRTGSPAPGLFRVEPRPGVLVWPKAGELQQGQIDADCIVTRNEPARLGTWGLHYLGDWDFIAETTALWRQAGWWERWEPAVIARGWQ